MRQRETLLEMAIRLEKAGWSSAEIWLRRQATYDLAQARTNEGQIIRPVPTTSTSTMAIPEQSTLFSREGMDADITKYVIMSYHTGARRFDTPPEIRENMTPKEQSRANMNYLEPIVDRRDTVVFSDPPDLAPEESSFYEE